MAKIVTFGKVNSLMMKLKNKIFFPAILIIAIAAIPSCKKKENCVGGAGGSLTVKVTLMHHNWNINSLANYRDTVRVRYNSLDYPSNGVFDATYIGDSGKAYVMIPGLKCGNYYFLGVGPDTIWSSGDTTPVKGGLPFTTEQTGGQVDITIPVAE